MNIRGFRQQTITEPPAQRDIESGLTEAKSPLADSTITISQEPEATQQVSHDTPRHPRQPWPQFQQHLVDAFP